MEPFTDPDQLWFAELWMRRDLTVTDIARVVGLSRPGVSWRARRLGLPKRRDGRIPGVSPQRARPTPTRWRCGCGQLSTVGAACERCRHEEAA
jgi:hypothetical protein